MNSVTPAFDTVVHMLADAARRSGVREALVCGDERLNYTDYQSCVAGFATEFIELGATGRHVAILMENSIDQCVAIFAAHAARAAAVTLNPLYTEHELRPILADAKPQVLVFGEKFAASIEPFAQSLGIPNLIRIGSAKRLMQWQGRDLQLPQPLPSPVISASLQYTGGTTGHSEGVRLSHRAICTNIAQREVLLLTRKDTEILLCVMPLFQIHAMAMCLHNMVGCRGTLVILPRFDADKVFDLLLDEHVTIFAGSPTLFTGMMNHPRFATLTFQACTCLIRDRRLCRKICFGAGNRRPVLPLSRATARLNPARSSRLIRWMVCVSLARWDGCYLTRRWRSWISIQAKWFFPVASGEKFGFAVRN